jgi:GNAT superfamily N-acetyltransferase
MQYTWREDLPAAQDFFSLYESTGWNERRSLTAEQLHLAISRSYYTLALYDGDALVAFGRLVSDGIYQCFVCDMIVLPAYQGKGLGRAVMERLVAHARDAGIAWLQLTCAKGKRGFYERLGFTARPDDAPGMEIYLA